MHALDQLAQALLLRLGWSSLQAVVLIALMALLIRLLPRLPAALRCTLWWLVGLQLMVGLVWHAPLQLPLLSPSAIQQVADTTATYPTSAPTVASTPFTRGLHPVAAHVTEPHPVHWPLLLGLLWLGGLALQLPGAIRHGRQSRTLLRESVPSIDLNLRAQCAATAAALGLRRPPRLRLSHAISSPQVTGLRRPTILLPARRVLTSEEAALALAHELAHLRRGDLWLGWIPALAQRLFYFHPLVAWAMREYALSREAACDAQVLAQPGTEAQRYGHLLLRLGVAQPVHAGLAGAAPSFHQLKRRLTMLQQTDTLPRQRRQDWLLVALIAVAGVLPYRLTATAANQPVTPAHASSTMSAPTMVAPSSQQVPLPPMPKSPPPPAPIAPSAPPTPPAPPVPPTPPAPPSDSDFAARHVSIDTSSTARDGFALFDGDTVMISGTDGDLAAAKRLHRENATMLWFRRGNQAWLIHDPTTLQRARTIYRPVTELATRQGRLAGQQGELAGRQAGLAARSGAFAQQQAELAQQQAQLARAAQHDRTAPAREARQAALEAQQAALERRQDVAQHGLDDAQHALEQEQTELEHQQASMEKRQQLASAQADRQLRKLLDEAIAKGIAQPASRR